MAQLAIMTPSDPNALSPDPLSDDRICLFPMKYNDMYLQYKKQISLFWTKEECDFSQDANDWQKVSSNVQNLLKHILSFFAIADGIVMKNIGENFLDAVQCPEAQMFYAAQMMCESVHADTYAETIKAFIPGEEEQNKLFQTVPFFPDVRAKKDFVEQWMHNDRPFYEKLVAFSCVEGLLFSASFASIYWVKESGLFPGLTQSNELISRDENLHCDFAILLHSHLNQKCPPETILQIVQHSIRVEDVFIENSIVNISDLQASDMKLYIRYLADTILERYGLPKHYNVLVPHSLSFMAKISVGGKTNFFEKRVSEYQRHQPVDSAKWCNDCDDF